MRPRRVGCTVPSDLGLDNFEALETARPLISLSGRQYAGKVVETPGTQFFWKHRGSDAAQPVPAETNAGDLEFVGRVHRVIKFGDL